MQKEARTAAIIHIILIERCSFSHFNISETNKVYHCVDKVNSSQIAFAYIHKLGHNNIYYHLFKRILYCCYYMPSNVTKGMTKCKTPQNQRKTFQNNQGLV